MDNNVDSEKVDSKSNKKKEKRPITLKRIILRRIIFIIIFLLVSIGVTYYFILSSNHESKEEIRIIDKSKQIEEEPKEFKSEKTINLSDTYDINDLKIETYKETYNEIKFEYYQIDGLKDKSIQTKINYNLKNDIENAIDEAFLNTKVNKENLYVYSMVASNFANTISISYDIYAFDNEENDYKNIFTKHLAENYDLNTGNKLKLKDLFIDDSSVSKKVLSHVYNDVVTSKSEIDYNDELEGTIKNYNDVEEEIYNLIYDFETGNEIPFHFNEQRIVLDDYYANIMYRDYLDYITIYDKYKTNETIFNGMYDNLNDLPVLVKRQEAEYTVLEKGNNYYIDISLFNRGNEKNEKVIKNAKKLIDEYVEEVKQEAKNSNKFIIVNRSYGLDQSGEYDFEMSEWISDGNYNMSIMSYRFEVTKSLFKSEIYDYIIHIFRNVPEQEMGEAYLFDNLFGAYLTYKDDTGEDYLTNLDKELNYNTDIIKIDSEGNIIDYVEDELFWDIAD